VWSADIFARRPGSTSVQLTGVSVAVLRLTRRRARKFLAYRPLGHWPETALWEPSDHSRRIVGHSERGQFWSVSENCRFGPRLDSWREQPLPPLIAACRPRAGTENGTICGNIGRDAGGRFGHTQIRGLGVFRLVDVSATSRE
jgi:hypothetical protein